MSAAELIKQVAALPPEERSRFEQLYQAMETDVTGPKRTEHWPEFGERLRRIYGAKVVADSQQIIDDGRGEF